MSRLKLPLTFIAAALVSLGVLFAVDLRGASAQGTTELKPKLTPKQIEEEMLRWRMYVKHLKPSDFGTPPESPGYVSPAQAEANKKAVTVAARKALPAMGRILIEVGLAYEGARIWIDNYVKLYAAADCGQLTGEATCPMPVNLSVKFRQAQYEASQLASGSPVFNEWNSQGQNIATGMVTQVDYQMSGNNCVYTVTYVAAGSISTGGVHALSNAPGYSAGSGCNGGTWSLLTPAAEKVVSSGTWNAYKSPFTNTAVEVTNPAGRASRPKIITEVSPNVTDTVYFGPLIVPRQPTTWKNPVFDWGETTEVQTAPSTGLTYGFVDSHNFVEAIRDEVCTLDAPLDVTPEVCPDYYPKEWELPEPEWEQWEEEFGDDDDDGILDPADPDDDNDGVPDASDPARTIPTTRRAG